MIRAVCGVLLLVLVIMAAGPSVPIHSKPIVAGTAAAVVYPLPYRARDVQTSWDLEVTLLNLINNERVAQGLAPLMPHATIRSVARAHGREMFAWGYLSHLSRSGLSPQQRVWRKGVRVRVVGENLAYAGDIREAHEALMASDAHRQNILLPSYQLVGIGVVDGGPYGVIVVQNFGN